MSENRETKFSAAFDGLSGGGPRTARAAPIRQRSRRNGRCDGLKFSIDI